MCVNFGDEILLRGEECKTRVNLNFFENAKMVNCCNSTGLQTLNFSRSRMMKWTSSLYSSREI